MKTVREINEETQQLVLRLARREIKAQKRGDFKNESRFARARLQLTASLERRDGVSSVE